MRRTLTLAFILLFLPKLSFSEFDFKNLKGARSYFQLKPEYEYLSPEIPLGLLRGGKLNQDFIYGEDSDSMIQFIRTAFNSVSESPAFFQVSPQGENIARFMGPSVLGKLIAQLSQHEPGAPPSTADLKKVVLGDDAFKTRIGQAIKAEEVAKKARDEYLSRHPEWSQKEQEIQELEDAVKDGENLKKRSKADKIKEYFPNGVQNCKDPTEKASLMSKVNEGVNAICEPIFAELERKKKRKGELEEELKKLKGEDKNLEKLNSTIKQEGYREQNLDTFLSKLIEAFRSEEKGHPRHYTEQILHAISHLNSGPDKGELEQFYGNLRHLMTETGKENLQNPKAKQNWHGSKFTAESYKG